MMWWAVWCAVVAAGAGAASAPAPDSIAPLDLVQMDSQATDDLPYGSQEGINYGIPPMGSRYASGTPWLYLLAEMPRESQVTSSETPLRPRRSFSVNPAVDVIQRNAYNSYLERLAFNNRNFLDRVGKRVKASSGRVKRRMPSLSIDLPMSVLRQKLSLEKERKVQALRAAANRNFLNDIGKRGFQWVPSLEAGKYY